MALQPNSCYKRLCYNEVAVYTEMIRRILQIFVDSNSNKISQPEREFTINSEEDEQ